MASGSTAGMDDDYEALISTTDMELLKRAWRNEKAAPEILRFETALIQRIRGQIQLMVTSQTLKSSNISV
jgi:GINS complex subunit 4